MDPGWGISASRSGEPYVSAITLGRHAQMGFGFLERDDRRSDQILWRDARVRVALVGASLANGPLKVAGDLVEGLRGRSVRTRSSPRTRYRSLTLSQPGASVDRAARV